MQLLQAEFSRTSPGKQLVQEVAATLHVLQVELQLLHTLTPLSTLA